MAIEIDDNVPLPDEGWTSKPATKRPACLVPETCTENYAQAANFGGLPVGPGPNDCTFIGGPLNGKFGPLRDNKPRVVEIEIYNADGSVASVELYALGDMHPTPTFRYHVGSKEL